MASSDPAILLDLDGTLVDSQPGIMSSCCAALRALGHEPPDSLDVSAVIGPPIEDVLRYLLKPYHDSRVTEAVVAYREDYGRNGMLNCLPYPGILETLSGLREAGASLYLATSKRTRFARPILQHFGLAGLFDGIQGSEDGGAFDHKPELIAHIMEEHELKAGHCVMVGDRRHDIFGAHSNGLHAIGVLWGYGSRDELEAAGADQLVASPVAMLDAARAAFMPGEARNSRV